MCFKEAGVLEGGEIFWKQKHTVRKTTASSQNLWNVGEKSISSKGCKGVVALEEHQVSESKKAKGKPREEVDDLGHLVDLKSQRVQ